MSLECTITAQRLLDDGLRDNPVDADTGARIDAVSAPVGGEHDGMIALRYRAEEGSEPRYVDPQTVLRLRWP